MVAEVIQGVRVAGTVRISENVGIGGLGYIVRSDLSGTAVFYTNVSAVYSDVDGTPQLVNGGEISFANCSMWTLNPDACNLDQASGLTCSDLRPLEIVPR
ncbi:MAG: hypothetical protein AAF542_07895 [Pseudomonadota bacterium]